MKVKAVIQKAIDGTFSVIADESKGIAKKGQTLSVIDEAKLLRLTGTNKLDEVRYPLEVPYSINKDPEELLKDPVAWLGGWMTVGAAIDYEGGVTSKSVGVKYSWDKRKHGEKASFVYNLNLKSGKVLGCVSKRLFDSYNVDITEVKKTNVKGRGRKKNKVDELQGSPF